MHMLTWNVCPNQCIGTDKIVSSIDLYEGLWQIAMGEISRQQYL